MTTIVLAESDRAASDSLATSLKALRSGWAIHQATSGEEVMALLRTVLADVIVCDSQLSDISGYDLFEQVSQVNANVIRITYSSDNNAEALMESTRTNHRFIGKINSPASLAANIDGSLRLRTLLADKTLTSYMSQVKSVPALPVIYDQMMKELASPISSLQKIGDIVESDAGLTVTVLKIVNSAFYALSRRVESVSQAVTLLGVHMIKNVTLTAKVFSRLEGSAVSIRRMTQLNNEAIRIGALANQFSRLAKTSRTTIDHCQITGMMANVGELIASANTDKPSDTLSTERIGASLLRSWAMPDTIIEAIALQYESPPVCTHSVTPLSVLHSIRYLQQHLTDAQNVQQLNDCCDYLCQYISEDIAKLWLDAFQAIEQLTATDNPHAA